jgi:hypothetical protein
MDKGGEGVYMNYGSGSGRPINYGADLAHRHFRAHCEKKKILIKTLKK